jgi:hypothetical protein
VKATKFGIMVKDFGSIHEVLSSILVSVNQKQIERCVNLFLLITIFFFLKKSMKTS